MKGKGLKGQDSFFVKKALYSKALKFSLRIQEHSLKKKCPWTYLEYKTWVGEVQEENYDNRKWVCGNGRGL